MLSTRKKGVRPLTFDINTRLTYAASMRRPLRIEYPGSLYHVASPGNESMDVFLDGRDLIDQLSSPYGRIARIWLCRLLYLPPTLANAQTAILKQV
jgi:hypothetical protein